MVPSSIASIFLEALLLFDILKRPRYGPDSKESFKNLSVEEITKATPSR